MRPRRRGSRGRQGQALVEYAMLTALMAVGLILMLVTLRNSVGATYNTTNNRIGQATGCGYAGSGSCESTVPGDGSGGTAGSGSEGTSGGSGTGGSGGAGGAGSGNSAGGNGQGNNGNGNGNGGGNGSNGQGGGVGNGGTGTSSNGNGGPKK